MVNYAPDSIKDPRLRRRLAEADARQNGGKAGPAHPPAQPPTPPAPARRLRQDPKPLMNHLEAEFYQRIADIYPNCPPVRIQAKRYRLGNGIWYKPDFSASQWSNTSAPLQETCWEVKGPKAFRGGFENLKVAASLYPEIRWLLVWKDTTTGDWKEQVILP